MSYRLKPGDPRIYQVTLVPRTCTEDGGQHEFMARLYFEKIVLLGYKRGRPSKTKEPSAEGAKR